jgi:hypothetical protein
LEDQKCSTGKGVITNFKKSGIGNFIGISKEIFIAGN